MAPEVPTVLSSSLRNQESRLRKVSALHLILMQALRRFRGGRIFNTSMVRVQADRIHGILITQRQTDGPPELPPFQGAQNPVNRNFPIMSRKRHGKENKKPIGFRIQIPLSIFTKLQENYQ